MFVRISNFAQRVAHAGKVVAGLVRCEFRVATLQHSLGVEAVEKVRGCRSGRELNV